MNLTMSRGAAPAGGVSSISNSDGTLTISPTTKLVVAALNLDHANNWTAIQTFSNATYSALFTGGNVGIGISTPLHRHTIAGTQSVASQKIGYLSTDNILISALDGGQYIGRVGAKERPLALSNYGVAFTPSNSGAANFSRVAMSSDGRVQIAAVGDGNFFISHDYGDTWTNYFQGGGYSLTMVAMSSDGKFIIAAGGSGAAYYMLSTDYGVTFDAPASHAAVISGADAVAMSSDGRIIVIADSSSSQIYISRDFAATFTVVKSGETWTSCAMSSDGKIITVGNNSNNSAPVYTSYDYGDTWSARTGYPVSSGQYPVALAMSADGKYQVIASSVGSGGDFLYLSADYGVNWVSIGPHTTQYSSVAMSADGSVISATSSEGDFSVFTSYDYGATFPAITALSNTLRSVAMSSDGKVIAVAVASDNIQESYADGVNYGYFTIAQNGTNSVNPTFKGRINSLLLTANENYALPPASGTFALQGDNISEFVNNLNYLSIFQRSLSTSDSLISTDYIGWCATSGGSFAIAIPDASTMPGKIFVIKDVDGNAATNNIVITPAAGNIENAGSLTMNINYMSVDLQSDGTNWWIISKYPVDLSSFITASSSNNLTNKSGNISQWTNDSGYSTLSSSQVAFIADTRQYVNQGADITSSTFNNTGRLNRVNYILEDTTADVTAGAVTLTISWTDVAGSTTYTDTQLLTGLGRKSGIIYINKDSGNVTMAVSHTGIFGSAKFALYVTVERLLN